MDDSDDDHDDDDDDDDDDDRSIDLQSGEVNTVVACKDDQRNQAPKNQAKPEETSSSVPQTENNQTPAEPAHETVCFHEFEHQPPTDERPKPTNQPQARTRGTANSVA